jgi:hypothetical protein
MKAANWKQLFKEKGWLRDGKIVAPDGCALYVQLAANKASLSIQSLPDPRQEVHFDDTFIIECNKDPRGDWHDEIYYLWEDIVAARLVIFTD